MGSFALGYTIYVGTKGNMGLHLRKSQLTRVKSVN